MTASGKPLKAIFDFDHTLYQDPPNRVELYQQAIQDTFTEQGIAITLAQAFQLNELMKYDHAGLNAQIASFGLIYESYFERVHENLSRRYVEKIEPSVDVRAAFARVAPDDKVILTHAPAIWIKPMLKKLGMDGLVKPENVLTIDHPMIGRARKDESDVPFRAALSLLGDDPANTVMFDDMDINLVRPHRMGMQTVQVVWDETPLTKPAYVDHQVRDISAFYAARPAP